VPELPEVETARCLIADQALHRRIADVDDSDSFVRRPHASGELRSALTGRSLTAAHRRGKTMWLETSGIGGAAGPGGPELGIHLGMSGRIVVTGPDGSVAEGGDPVGYGARLRRAEWSRFTLRFADGGSLVPLDPRRLGRVRLNPDIAALGPDATQVTLAEFRILIMKGTIAVKARLLDQSKIAGIGNLLADEILWQARVSPLARVGSLSSAQVNRLYRALKSVLESALAKGGAHTGDMIAARHPGGTCPRDGAPMAHGTVGGRSTWWCSREQALRPDKPSPVAGGAGHIPHLRAHRGDLQPDLARRPKQR
jgi:formamidopyrimidine-DNA glycosylase